MKGSILGRADLLKLQKYKADLLEVLHNKDDPRAPALTKLLGFEYELPKLIEPHPPEKSPPGGGKGTETGEMTFVEKGLQDARFWLAVSFKTLPSDERTKKKIELTVEPPKPVKIEKPAYQYLSSWEKLKPRLRLALAHHSDSNRLDLATIVDQFARVQIPKTLPYEQQSSWGSSLQVIDDRSSHMAPYLDDHIMLHKHLIKVFPETAFEQAFMDQSFSEPLIHARDGGITEYRPPPGGRVLILSDLGSLAKDSGQSRQFWCLFGRRLRAAKCKVVVLLPCSAKQCGIELQSLYHLISWEHPAPPVLAEQEQELAIEQLLQLLAPTQRFSPGLLRAVRLSLGANAPPASIESALWQNQATEKLNLTVSALKQKESMRRYKDFKDKDNKQQQQVLEKIRAWHYNLPIEIWYATLWNLPEKAQAVVDPKELQAATQFLTYISGRSQTQSPKPLGANAQAWVYRNLECLSDSALNNPALKEVIKQLNLARNRWQNITPDDKEAAGEKLLISQQGAQLQLAKINDQNRLQSSLLAGIYSSDGNVVVEIIPEKSEPDFWQTNSPPEWAMDWGHDHYSPWVDFCYSVTGQNIVQRMRWISPGAFLMGSLEDEPGRHSDEGPQHKVILEQGYWLFDTPVTQALWQAITGDNRSYFKSPERPVETVSWEDCQEFIKKINQKIPGLELSLPSEAQWEYACRAGTTTALYSGPIEIIGERNAPALDNIAWYGGNSGQDFELDNGYDTSDWQEKQYQDTKQGTHPVALKAANPWGLYDMLGNVWEWTVDSWHGDYNRAPFDGRAWEDLQEHENAGHERVLRGGSWNDRAQDCRSAYRDRSEPGFRYGLIGFRCARVQVSQVQGAVPALSGSARRLEPEEARMTELGAARRVGQLNLAHNHFFDLPKALANTVGRLLLRSDCEQLILQRITKPSWANAIGRDRFGLWAEISLKDLTKPIKQRLRWIPPGQFLMGSPESEPGRWSAEGPQHKVILKQGYWLFNTPVTQALWQAVMGENKSEFKSPERPVENVSWNDCQQFIKRINQKIPELELSLPSEAQWEYACRAGTTTALYSGPIEIIGERNAPALDNIAWYGGNSGQDFELDNSYDTSDWPEKQYQDTKQGTHPVVLKAANPWGLYEMLGNVWEWTADSWHGDYKRAPFDGLAWENLKEHENAGHERVLRGGSWDVRAQGCRSACRLRGGPGFRLSNFGFRCVRVQA